MLMPTPPLSSYARLLYANGDHRLCFDPVTGYNPYRCARLPDPGLLALGSCTGSTPVPAMDVAARALYRHWGVIYARGPAAWQAFQIDCFEQIRHRLLQLLRLDHLTGLQVALAGSGTDCEFLATWLAVSVAKRPLANLVVGPLEVGAGVLHAAAGRQFTDTPPFASAPRAALYGMPVAGFPPIGFHAIPLRDPYGECLPAELIDAKVSETASALILSGHHVLLHLNAGSKTGIFAPSVSCVQALCAAWPESVTVVVDAAQGRMARSELHACLAAGWLVYVTGSKFYGGPSFSGALLIPERFPVSPRFAPGLAEWFCPGELPLRWRHWQRHLPLQAGPGRLLRWVAAQAGMEPYYALPKSLRDTIFARFEALLQERLAGHELITPCLPPAMLVARAAYPYRTIFPFTVRPRAGAPCLPVAALARLRDRLEQGLCPPAGAGPHAASGRFHIGQPVRLSAPEVPELSVLRLALGAPLVLRLAQERALGPDLAARLDWLARQLDQLVCQLTLLAGQEVSGQRAADHPG